MEDVYGQRVSTYIQKQAAYLSMAAQLKAFCSDGEETHHTEQDINRTPIPPLRMAQHNQQRNYCPESPHTNHPEILDKKPDTYAYEIIDSTVGT